MDTMKYLIPLIASVGLAASPAMAGTCGSKAKTIAASHHSTEMADIVDTAKAAGLTTLVAAVEAAGLVDALKSDGPLTVFAPSNEAFAKLGDEKIAELLKPENKHTLAAILKYHVVAGKVTAADLIGKTTTVETLDGIATVDGRNGVTVNTSKVIQADVTTSNGIVHVIDTVLIPPSN